MLPLIEYSIELIVWSLVAMCVRLCGIAYQLNWAHIKFRGNFIARVTSISWCVEAEQFVHVCQFLSRNLSEKVSYACKITDCIAQQNDGRRKNRIYLFQNEQTLNWISTMHICISRWSRVNNRILWLFRKLLLLINR